MSLLLLEVQKDRYVRIRLYYIQICSRRKSLFEEEGGDVSGSVCVFEWASGAVEGHFVEVVLRRERELGERCTVAEGASFCEFADDATCATVMSI